jgi:hypothetical protein
MVVSGSYGSYPMRSALFTACRAVVAIYTASPDNFIFEYSDLPRCQRWLTKC